MSLRVIDDELVLSKLRLVVARLFAVSNQIVAISYRCPAARELTAQIDDRVHIAIDELKQIADSLG